jgi:hypothetical protein
MDGQLAAYSGFGGIITKVENVSPFRGLSLWANFPYFSSLPAWTRYGVQLDVSSVVVFSHAQHLNDNRFRLIVTRRNGTDLSIRINGHYEGGSELSAGVDYGAIGSHLYIGGRRYQPLDGEIAELALVRASVTDSDVTRLEDHLMTKYALAR